MRYTSSAKELLTRRSHLHVVCAGLAGGLVEMAWIGFYSSLASVEAAEVARQVTWTVLPFPMAPGTAEAAGIGIHLVLSIILAALFAVVVYGPTIRRFGNPGVFVAGLAVLSLVWAVNFFVLLPVLNAGFPAIMPYTVTFTSKLLFGAVMAGALVYGPGRTLEPAR